VASAGVAANSERESWGFLGAHGVFGADTANESWTSTSQPSSSILLYGVILSRYAR
jgi:hypothetical protein